MNDSSSVIIQDGILRKMANGYREKLHNLSTVSVFKLIIRLIFIVAILSAVYWVFVASDRYVSDASVIIQKTDEISNPNVDISTIVPGAAGPSRSDQLLLREYLLSADMLKKLDAALDLRAHYSDRRWDPVSRMWFKNAPPEWFYRYWLSRIDVEYDDYSGVLRISAQAYDPKTAQAIAAFMVREGEAHMNQIGHDLAQSQVDYLTKQVTLAHDRVIATSNDLIDFQNRKGLMAPQATAESLNALIDKLEAQRTEVQAQLDSLPPTLSPNQPTVVMLRSSLKAIDQQIAQKQAELTSPSRRTLNYTVGEFQRLQMQAGFAQDLYKTALAALEKGRMDAARTLKMVSPLQAPTTPSYPMEPQRMYNTILTLLAAIALAGIVKLLEGIILDHVD
ncbi:chain-length determining protein [Paraburkholderia sp. J11-2]|uniref:chain-length determining protein n=1 Tax=Paraburkholderia sp. J11-2 TaxID=2805431 RepID=UPI002AB74578|nr:chain-length determining protein [Paraburkholderia sp. J11-2]